MALLAVVAIGAGATISSARSAVVTGALMLLCVFLLFLLLMMVLAKVFELGAGKGTANGTDDTMVHLVASVCTSSTTCQGTHHTTVTFDSRLATV